MILITMASAIALILMGIAYLLVENDKVLVGSVITMTVVFGMILVWTYYLL